MSQPSASRELVQHARAGDHQAFTALIRDADERMRRLAYRLLGSRTAMDDALQDAYLKAYRRFGSYRGQGAFSTWLYAIVYRTCLDHLKAQRRRAETDLGSTTELEADETDIGQRQGDADALNRALRALPAEQAAVVLLVDGDGCTYDQAAAILEVREGTIASRLHRAHRTLREALTAESEEGRVG